MRTKDHEDELAYFEELAESPKYWADMAVLMGAAAKAFDETDEAFKARLRAQLRSPRSTPSTAQGGDEETR